MALKFVSELTDGEKRMALYLLDHHPELWRSIHGELASIIYPGTETEVMKAGARICARVGHRLWMEHVNQATRSAR